jgi:ubiquinone/menaquinone biosynthesis C-methylase UbiE
VSADALRLPFDDRSVDVVTSTLFLHHLSDADAIRAMREMKRVARLGMVVADLLRGRRAYFWISLLTLRASSIIRHDARASVAQAFTLPEIERLARQADLDPISLFRTFGHRFLLCWKRE